MGWSVGKCWDEGGHKLPYSWDRAQCPCKYLSMSEAVAQTWFPEVPNPFVLVQVALRKSH